MRRDGQPSIWILGIGRPGLEKISMPGANIGSFKRNLAQVEWKDLQDLGAELLEKDTAEAIQAAVDSFMKRNAL